MIDLESSLISTISRVKRKGRRKSCEITSAEKPSSMLSIKNKVAISTEEESCETGRDTIEELENQIALLKSDLQEHRDIMDKAATTTNKMAEFYNICMREIYQAGFDLTKIPVIQSVLPEGHLASLQGEISQLRQLEQRLGQSVPQTRILEDFHSTLTFLRNTPSLTPTKNCADSIQHNTA